MRARVALGEGACVNLVWERSEAAERPNRRSWLDVSILLDGFRLVEASDPNHPAPQAVSRGRENAANKPIRPEVLRSLPRVRAARAASVPRTNAASSLALASGASSYRDERDTTRHSGRPTTQGLRHEHLVNETNVYSFRVKACTNGFPDHRSRQPLLLWYRPWSQTRPVLRHAFAAFRASTQAQPPTRNSPSKVSTTSLAKGAPHTTPRAIRRPSGKHSPC
jgi:hypothetical protein